MRKITADWVFPVDSDPIQQGVIVVSDEGQIQSLGHRSSFDISELEVYSGSIVPGFINTHCHLELSHMRGKVDTGTGLIPFISNVVTRRQATAEIIAEAIEKAENDMLRNGIVACGDISNVPDTFATKARGRMRYYTFVEMFDFLQDANAAATFEQYLAVFEQIELHKDSRRSTVPHAPYSVSPTLFGLLNAHNSTQTDTTISIHNQETPPENALFEHGTGDFYDFYAKFGISLHTFEPPKTTSIHYAIAQMNPQHRTLFVHNTLTTAADIAAAQQWSDRTYWASCPNANLYIENRLPNYQTFVEAGAKVTLGTDSLTSNWQLCILSEMQAIARFQSYIKFPTLLQWATLNGAQALGFDDTLGSLTVGKTPGILLLEHFDGINLTDKTSVRRL